MNNQSADAISNYPKEHVFKAHFFNVGKAIIRTVIINDKYYFCLRDVQEGAGMKNSHRSQLSRRIYKIYTHKIRTNANARLSAYVNQEGVQILLARSREVECRHFLSQFIDTILPYDKNVEFSRIDFTRFLQVIINTTDENDRKFLYSLYETLGGGSIYKEKK